MPTCPHCEHDLSVLKHEPVTLGLPDQHQFRGVAYSCPDCGATLGVEADPIALKSDLIEELVATLTQR